MKRIEYSSNARRTLHKLDKLIGSQIINKIELLSKNPELLEIKKMKGQSNLFRIRSGYYRIIFEIQIEFIYIIKIGHRKDIYK